MEKGSRSTAPSATARVKVQSPSLREGRASAPALGLGPRRGHGLAMAPRVTGPHGLGGRGGPAGQGEEVAEHPAGREWTGRNLRNPVDSSILIIMNCRGKQCKPRGLGEAGLPGASLPACSSAHPQTSPLLQMLQKHSQGIWALLPSRGSRGGVPQRPMPQQPRLRWDRGSREEADSDGGTSPGEAECGCRRLPGSGSSRPPTCREVCVLLEVGYDEVAKDVEAGEEQGADLQAEECGQHRQEAPRAALPPQAMPPAPAPISSTLFVFPLLALVTPHTCAQPCPCMGMAPMGAHKLPQHPGGGRGVKTPGRAHTAALGQSVQAELRGLQGSGWPRPCGTPIPPTALTLLAPAPGRAVGTALSQAPRPATVSLPPLLVHRGPAGADNVRGTRRPFIPPGTRQDGERSPEPSTLAQAEQSSHATSLLPGPGGSAGHGSSRTCWVGRQGARGSGPAPDPRRGSACFCPEKGLRLQVPSCHKLYPAAQSSAWLGGPQHLLHPVWAEPGAPG